MCLSILRRSIATALITCMVVFSGCLEDQEILITEPITESVEKTAGPYLQNNDAVVFQYKETSEAAIVAQFGEWAAAVVNFEKEPESFSEFMMMLNENSNVNNTYFNLDAAIASYEQGYAAQDDQSQSPLGIYLDDILDVAASQVYSPIVKYERLQECKEQFTNAPPLELNNEEANAILYEINFQAALVKAFSPEEFGGAKAYDEIKFIIDIIKAFFPDFSNLLVDLSDRNKCDLAKISLAYSIISCASGGVVSCFLIPLKIKKLIKKCKEKIPYCTLNPSPCCGVVCVQGYVCNSSTDGKCELDPYFDNCDNCRPGEECVNGVCRPF